jgi:hypothetical protein
VELYLEETETHISEILKEAKAGIQVPDLCRSYSEVSRFSVAFGFGVPK